MSKFINPFTDVGFKRMPFLAQDAVFKRLSEIAEVAALSKEERREYDESLKHYRDTIAVMHGQYLEGMEKGMETGVKKEKRETVIRLQSLGLSVDQIAKGAGLTVEEVTQLLR